MKTLDILKTVCYNKWRRQERVLHDDASMGD